MIVKRLAVGTVAFGAQVALVLVALVARWVLIEFHLSRA